MFSLCLIRPSWPWLPMQVQRIKRTLRVSVTTSTRTTLSPRSFFFLSICLLLRYFIECFLIPSIKVTGRRTAHKSTGDFVPQAGYRSIINTNIIIRWANVFSLILSFCKWAMGEYDLDMLFICFTYRFRDHHRLKIKLPRWCSPTTLGWWTMTICQTSWLAPWQRTRSHSPTCPVDWTSQRSRVRGWPRDWPSISNTSSR